MNVKPLLQHINPDTFIIDYLKANNVQDIERYLEPDDSCFEGCYLYPNIDEAVDRLYKGLENGEKIGVLVDSDSDGQLSAAIIVDLLKENNADYQVFIHSSKQHGLRIGKDENIIEQVINANINLLIIPDAGTGDANECRDLKEQGIDTICIDHHPVSVNNPYAIVVNHHLTPNLNTALSGTGVTHKFALWFNSRQGLPDTGKYYDMVAMSIISDVCSFQSLENRSYVAKGFEMLNTHNENCNPILQLMADKLCRGEPVDPHNASWNIIPPINSLCRGDNQEDKLTFFKALIGEESIEEGLKVARRAHRIQTETIKRIAEEVEPSLELEHKVVYGFADASDASYIGLAANKFVSKFGKPVFILREADSTTYSGSLRSPVPLSEIINASKFGKAQGHSEAAGVYVKKSQLPKLIAYLDKTLNLDVHPDINVTAILKPRDITVELCKAVSENKMLFGHGLEPPVFYCQQSFTKNQVQTFVKKTTTLKLSTNGVDFLKFQANDKDITNLSKPDFTIGMIVELSTNEWNGVVSPQAIIKDYEIVGDEDKDLTWEAMF